VLRWLLVMGVMLVLQACASTNMGYQLSEGKRNFIGGNYKQSFHELLPLASQGNANAEYAVGYMYYYGYGVPLDAESGLFWMQKAADQHYEPAIKALDMIHNQKRLQGSGMF
jgi:TPR repeat protein